MKKSTYLFTALFAMSLLFIACGEDDKPTDSGGDDIPIIQTVTICDQVWMVKNLNVDHYRNGEPIPELTDQIQWENLTTGAWCYYDNDSANGAIYGKLYNWYAVNDPRGLAPDGWHIPTDDEWKEIEMCLGMSQSEADTAGYGARRSNVGGKLKTTGTIEGGDGLWKTPNSDATNEIGFSAYPGGLRFENGMFDNIGLYGYWWTSSEPFDSYVWLRFMSYDHGSIDRINRKKGNGQSVRCVKD